MDCCPVMVSDLPVMCSRVDGVVTVVKTDHLNSTRPYPDRGKFLLAPRLFAPVSKVSSLSFYGEPARFIGELQVQKPWNLQYDSAWRVINSAWSESALFHKWVSLILQQQKLIYGLSSSFQPHTTTQWEMFFLLLLFVNISSFVICFSLQ